MVRGNAIVRTIGIGIGLAGILLGVGSCSWTHPEPPRRDRTFVPAASMAADPLGTSRTADPTVRGVPDDAGPMAILPSGERVDLSPNSAKPAGGPPARFVDGDDVDPGPMAILPSGERVPLDQWNATYGNGDRAPVPTGVPTVDDPAASRDGNPFPLTVPRPGPVLEGGPRVTALLPDRSRRAEFDVEYRVEGHTSPVERVEIWVTPDNGQHWRLHGYDPDCTSPFELALPDGEWGVWWVVTTTDNRSTYPAPGDAPRSSVAVDTEPPAITFADPHVWADGRGAQGEVVGVELAFQVDDAHLDHRSILCESRSGDGPWRLIDAPEGIARTTVPAGPDPLRIRVTARDRFGHSGSRERVIHPVDRLSPPSVVFVDPPAEWVGGTRTVRLSWEGRWPSNPAATATIEFAVDGADWRTIATDLPATGTTEWRVPRVATRSGELRVRLVGSAPREQSPTDTRTLSIDPAPPVARIVAPVEGEGSGIPILVETGDSGGSGLAELELWRHDEGRWVLASTAEPGASILFDPPSPGTHSLWVVARDAAGLESDPPPVDASRAFRFTARGGVAQRIRLLSFREGGYFPAGGRHLVFFEVTGAAPETTVVHLEWSNDDGRTWSRRGTATASEGRLPLVLPREEVLAARVRVVAEEVSGRRSEDRSPVPFHVVSRIPDVRVTNIVPTLGGGSAIHFEVTEGRRDAIERLFLFHRDPRTGRWDRWPGSFAAESPIVVDLPPTAAVELRARDRAGNTGVGPVATQLPRSTDVPAPVVEPGRIEWLTEGGRTVAGGSRHYLFWRTPGTLPAPTARLEQRIGPDGAWVEVARDLPGTGRRLWTAPEANGEEVHLRLVTAGAGGDVVAALPDPFVVDDHRPSVLAVGPGTSRTRVTMVETRAGEDDDLDLVEVWVRLADRPDWRRAGEGRPGSPLAVELSDGRYHVTAVGVDRAGNRSSAPVRGSKGQLRMLVDTVAPILRIDEADERKRVFRRGQTMVLRPRVHDAHLSNFPLTLQVIEQGETEAKPLQRFHPNATEFHWILPTRAGVHTLEVIAEDLAGNRTVERIPVTVVPTPPRPVLLTDLADRVLPAGHEVTLEWETDGIEPGEGPVTVQFAADGEHFETIFDRQPVDGSIVWRVPFHDSNRCRVRLVVTGTDGLRGEATSGRFTVSESPPKVRAGAIRPAQED